jgi:multicomponent Na+:H+ antiporter subunit A
MNAPALVFLLAGLLSISGLALRRRRVASLLIASIGCSLIGMILLYAPIDEAVSIGGASLRLEGTWQILGRSIEVGARNRAAVALLFLSGAVFFVSGLLGRPGRSFAPVGILILVLLTGALSIEPFLFAAVFLELAAMASILVLVPPGSRARPRVLQLLVLYTLAMVAILFTGWLLENVGVTSVTPELALRVMLLLGFGFSILLLVPPFHFWLPGVAKEVNPLSLAFVAASLQGAGFFLLLRFLDSFAWLRADARVVGGITAAGILMVLMGSVSALAQTSFKKMGAYVLLADFGIPLIAVGTNEVRGFELALVVTGMRVLSLALWSLGTAIVERRSQDLEAEGVGRDAPLAAAASLIGVLSLGGLPFTTGFPGRWAIVSSLPMRFGSEGFWLAAGSGLVLLCALRWAFRWFTIAGSPITIKPPERYRIAFAFIAAVFFVLAVFPQVANLWVAPAMAGFANLTP